LKKNFVNKVDKMPKSEFFNKRKFSKSYYRDYGNILKQAVAIKNRVKKKNQIHVSKRRRRARNQKSTLSNYSKLVPLNIIQKQSINNKVNSAKAASRKNFPVLFEKSQYEVQTSDKKQKVYKNFLDPNGVLSLKVSDSGGARRGFISSSNKK
jgi:hypothetical protein